MPTEPPATPRKMLPPPMTTATSQPSCVTSWTSRTMRTIVARLMPYASSPIKASPESLSRMRLYAAMAPFSWFVVLCSAKSIRPATWLRAPLPRSGALGGGDLRRDLGREIAGLLLDALANDIEREGLDARRLLLEHLRDGLLVVLHEGLVVEADLLQVFRHRALDAPGDDLGRLH